MTRPYSGAIAPSTASPPIPSSGRHHMSLGRTLSRRVLPSRRLLVSASSLVRHRPNELTRICAILGGPPAVVVGRPYALLKLPVGIGRGRLHGTLRKLCPLVMIREGRKESRLHCL